MAIAVAQFVNELAFNGNAKTATISYVSGDILVVAAGGENGDQAPVENPTATNVTFDPVGSSPSNAGFSEAAAGMWVGEATGSGSSVTINGGTFGDNGGCVWKVTGATLTGKVELGPNLTESTFSQLVAAGDAVFYFMADWNAHTGDLTGATGSGTLTERADDGNGASWGWWAGEWLGTAAGTFGFGLSSYASVQVNHCALVLKSGASTSLTLEAFRLGTDDGTEAGHGWEAAQDVEATLAKETTHLLRTATQETGGASFTGGRRLQVRRDDEPTTEWRNA